MTVASNNSALGGEVAPSDRAANNTSSQIFLSRGVASTADRNASSILPETPIQSQARFISNKLPSNVRVINKAEDSDMARGRTAQRASKHRNPLAKAESRPRPQRDSVIEVDMRPIRRHTHCRGSVPAQLQNLAQHFIAWEDNLLEPYPRTQVQSAVAEVLNSSSDNTAANNTFRPTNHTGIKSPPRAHENYSRDSRPFQPALAIPSESLNSILWCDRNVKPMNIKSHSPILKADAILALPHESSNPTSLGAQLPTEILQQIFCLLTAEDFNSARRICRPWFISSLEVSLLKIMLRRGGWSSCMQHDLEIKQTRAPGHELNEAWIMSKRIARECALGPDWTGNGLSDNEVQNSSSKNSGFVHTSTVDFTEVPVPHAQTGAPGVIFTVSNCGKFLMATNGCLIYVYELNRSHKHYGTLVTCPGSLRPVTSIICPRRVLACSMDTSSCRYAIAVLLDGRVGLVCDISPDHITPRAASKSYGDHPGDALIIRRSQPPSNESLGAESSQGQIYPESSSPNFVSNRSINEPHFVFRGIATAVTSAPNEYIWQESPRG